MHGASEQCMQATDIDFSPGSPSFNVTTRRRFTPHGISCSCLHAVTQPLHSMQRSASHRNFILAICIPPHAKRGADRPVRSSLFMPSAPASPTSTACFLHLAKRSFAVLNHRDDVVAVRHGGVDRL